MSAEPHLSECVVGSNVIACYGPRNIHRRIVLECWTCEKRTPHILHWDGAWYGTTRYCVACLDGWIDGWRMERPFRRYWKRDRAARIKDLWDSALLPRDYKAWTNLDIHGATCDAESDCPECDGKAVSA